MKKTIVLLIAAVLVFASCTAAPKANSDTTVQKTDETLAQEKTAEPTDKPTEKPTEEMEQETGTVPNLVAIVIAMDRYATTELDPVIAAVITAGYDFVLVSSETGQAQGTEDLTEVRNTFSEYSPEDLLGIIVIGGSESLWENEELQGLIGGMHELDRVTAGICLNAVMLAKAGVIGEGDSACWFNCDSADAEMEALGVADSGQPVTVNGNIITGNGPDAAEEFAAEVVKALDALG